MSKPKTTRKARKTIPVIKTAVIVNAIGQAIEPFLSQLPALISAAQAKDLPSFLSVLRTASRETASIANLIQLGGPLVGYAVLTYIRKYVKMNPRFGPLRVF